MTVPALPPIGGYILTGQLRIRQAAHAPVILRHDMTTEFFGVREREGSWPDFHTFRVYPISTAALGQLRAMLADDDRHEIDTGHPAFGWIPRPKEPSPELAGLPARLPSLFVTTDEQAAHRAAQLVPIMSEPQLQQPVIQVGSNPADFDHDAAVTARAMADRALTYLTTMGDPDEVTSALAPSLAAAIRAPRLVLAAFHDEANRRAAARAAALMAILIRRSMISGHLLGD